MPNKSLQEAFRQLPRLAVFVEVAREGSFKRAGEALGLAPSTVSHHLHELEQALGVTLLRRTSRAVALTPAGNAMLSEAQEVVDTWDRGARRARMFTEGPTGTLVVTAPDIISERIVVPAAMRMMELHASVSVDIRVEFRNLDLLRDGIDVAVRRGPLADSSYGARLLYEDHYGIFAAPNVARQWRPEHPADLAAAPWVQHRHRDHIIQLTHPRHQDGYTLDAPIRAHASVGGTLLRLVVSGAGFALLPHRLVRDEIEAGELVPVLEGWTSGKTSCHAVTPSPTMSDAKVTQFVRLLFEVVDGAEQDRSSREEEE